jgi:hypothetical protein
MISWAARITVSLFTGDCAFKTEKPEPDTATNKANTNKTTAFFMVVN